MTTDVNGAPGGQPPTSRNPSSPYCQRWTGGRHSWRHVSEGGFDATLFDVRPIPEALARSIVASHHYAGTLPATRLSWGLLTRDDRLIDDSTPLSGGLGLVGVACLSVPMTASVLTNVFPQLEPFTESLELGRLVLTDPVPANAESWFLARVWRQAAAVGLRGIVSFADPLPRQRTTTRTLPDGTAAEVVETISPGHVGACYQGAGAIACGRSTARTLIYLPRHGTVLSERTLSKIRLQESGSAAAERHLVALGAAPRPISQDPQLGCGPRWTTSAQFVCGTRATSAMPGRSAHADSDAASRLRSLLPETRKLTRTDSRPRSSSPQGAPTRERTAPPLRRG